MTKSVTLRQQGKGEPEIAPSPRSPESLEAEQIAYSQGAEAYMEWKNEHEAANSLREVRPDDGSPSCHVCGAIMVPASKGFKCFSCGATTEPTGPAPSVVESRPRTKGIYVGAPACFALELAAKHLTKAFGSFGCYVVGSALVRPDWRDVDVRYIMEDGEFAKLFPKAGQNWEHDERWILLNVSLSAWLSHLTGLPIDFQMQPQTHANERHKGLRNAIGLDISE